MEPSTTLTCVECAGKAHMVSSRPADQPWEAGDRVAYVCEDCNQRLDVELAEDDDEVGEFAGQ